MSDECDGSCSGKQEGPASPNPSHLSMRSNDSMLHPLNLKSSSVLEESDSLTDVQDVQQFKISNQSSDHWVEFKEFSTALSSQETLKSHLRRKFQCLREGTSEISDPVPLNDIYTELYITQSRGEEITLNNNEHEIRLIEAASRRTSADDTPINCSDIFRPSAAEDKPIRTALTKGVAGIGKTVSVQKFILDWAEGKENQDVHLIFPLPFRELNLMRGQKFCLEDLLHFFMDTKQISQNISQYLKMSQNESKILFIFDGLDECRLSLDFHSSVRLCDVCESASVDVLLTNLIKGNLLPSALIWITSRPAAADLIPSECVDRVTEVRGFSDQQKQEYFRKRISDESLANRIISHLKSSRSLYIMCHIPVFCWISATVLERVLSEAESGEIPKTLTQMYTHFLLTQTNIKHQKDYEKKVREEDLIFKLGKLAFEQLKKGNLIFYEEDLRQCNIDVQEASVYSGLCTQIFREELGLFQKKAYCFVHLSVQEHLAALYVYLTFMNEHINVLDQQSVLPALQLSVLPSILTCAAQGSVVDLYQTAMKKALQSANGHLDLFLRFFVGFLLESNQALLQNLLTEPGESSFNKEKVAQLIKMKIKENSPEKSVNLFHCLNELNDHCLVEEVQHYLKSGSRINENLSSLQWSAMVFVLLTSGQNLDLFDVDEYVEKGILSNKALKRLQLVIEASRTAKLSEHSLTQKNYTTLVSVLTSKTSCVRELILTNSSIRDEGLKLLCAGLSNPQCQLETLRLEFCGLSDKGCAALASALRSNPSHLRELSLSGNQIRTSGVKLLSTELRNPQCKLEKLLVNDCDITDEGCAALASALKSNPSHLRELSLSGNTIRTSGVKLLSTELANPFCKLEKLLLRNCCITDEGCSALASALRSNSHLTQLDLSKNKLKDLGVKLISDGLEGSDCKLEILILNDCGITDEGCAALTSALRSNPSHLRQLDLSGNKLTNTGVMKLSGGLELSDSNLKILRLVNCGITDEGCAALASVLRSNSHLTELNLDWNKIGDSGVKPLFAALENPNCKLEVLRLRNCIIEDEGYAALASMLRSNSSHLKELDLSQSKFRMLGIKMLSSALENPDCKLEILRLEYCGITDEGCAILASALKSNPSHLRELDLYMNHLGGSGEKLFSDLKDDPNYKLETVKY